MKHFFILIFLLIIASCASYPSSIQPTVDEMEENYKNKNYLQAYENAVLAHGRSTYKYSDKIIEYVKARPEISEAGSRYIIINLEECRSKHGEEQCQCFNETLKKFTSYTILGNDADINKVYEEYLHILTNFKPDELECFSMEYIPSGMMLENKKLIMDACLKQVDFTINNKTVNPATRDNVDYLLHNSAYFRNWVCDNSDKFISLGNKYYKGIVFRSCEDIKRQYLAEELKVIFIDIQDEDFELRELLESRFKANCLIEVTDDPDQNFDYKISVKRIRLQYQSAQEKTREIIIPSSQYNLGAALFYPTGSSVIYNVHEKEVSLKYAYKIEIYKKNQKIMSDIVKGTLSDNSRYADSPRCRNVFGGISGVPIYPNAQMASDFSNSKNSASEEGLCNLAFEKIFYKIYGAEGIERLMSAGEAICEGF